MSRILAVDPGNTESAYVLLENGKVVDAEKVTNDRLRFRLHAWPGVESTLLAVEMIASYGMPVGKEVFETCVWIGRFVEAWAPRGGRFELVYRRDVKLHLCGSARANDGNIRAALIDKFGPGKAAAVGLKKSPGPLYGLKGDAWAALGVAVTVGEKNDLAVPAA